MFLKVPGHKSFYDLCNYAFEELFTLIYPILFLDSFIFQLKFITFIKFTPCQITYIWGFFYSWFLLIDSPSFTNVEWNRWNGQCVVCVKAEHSLFGWFNFTAQIRRLAFQKAPCVRDNKMSHWPSTATVKVRLCTQRKLLIDAADARTTSVVKDPSIRGCASSDGFADELLSDAVRSRREMRYEDGHDKGWIAWKGRVAALYDVLSWYSHGPSEGSYRTCEARVEIANLPLEPWR